MRKMKKWLTTGVATLLIGTMTWNVGTIVSSATLFGDVDGNGTINISDVVALNKFLNGKGVLKNYNDADANVNGILDSVDAAILLDFVVGNIKSIPYLGD